VVEHWVNRSYIRPALQAAGPASASGPGTGTTRTAQAGPTSH